MSGAWPHKYHRTGEWKTARNQRIFSPSASLRLRTPHSPARLCAEWPEWLLCNPGDFPPPGTGPEETAGSVQQISPRRCGLVHVHLGLNSQGGEHAVNILAQVSSSVTRKQGQAADTWLPRAHLFGSQCTPPPVHTALSAHRPAGLFTCMCTGLSSDQSLSSSTISQRRR